jgi:hypothetical protein
VKIPAGRKKATVFSIGYEKLKPSWMQWINVGGVEIRIAYNVDKRTLSLFQQKEVIANLNSA